VRVYLTNLGCKLNQAEVERLGRDLRAAGHQVVRSLEEADLHVVNTCTVTHLAARDSRKAAGRAARVRETLRTVVTGCWATEKPGEAERIEGVDLVVPNAEKHLLVEKIQAAFPAPEARPPADPEVPYLPLPAGHTRALVKVEDGCNMRCAFCIIPATRGRQRSRPLEEVVAETRSLVEAGFAEIVVTGVQISAYRDAGGRRLVDLARALLRETGVPRLRLTSIAPWDLDERLLSLWEDPAHEGRLCRHLHLSLQSGSTATLRRMRRPYTADSYGRLLERVRAAVPGVGITTDVIAGFPGESEAEFAESLAFVASAGFAKVHAFPFSPREGTEAAGLPNQVPPEVRKERMARLLAAAEAGEVAFRRACLGGRATVLWERPRNGVGHGLTDNYLRVFNEAAAGLWNRLTEVELVELAEGGVIGRLVAEVAPTRSRI
jgi:threonylcarbamoyladenosine tRNA methylthiotransferase MtaB